MAQQTAAPTHRVYTVVDRGDGKDPFWLAIGAMWENKDKKGFSITLQALPLDGRLVVREVDSDEKPEPAPPANVTDARGYRDRRGK